MNDQQIPRKFTNLHAQLNLFSIYARNTYKRVNFITHIIHCVHIIRIIPLNNTISPKLQRNTQSGVGYMNVARDIQSIRKFRADKAICRDLLPWLPGVAGIT